MPTYGVNINTGVARDGRIAFTGWTNVLGDQANSSNTPVQIGQTSGAVYFNGQTNADDRIAKVFRKTGSRNLAMRQLMVNLLGVAAGASSPTGTANSYMRVRGPSQTVSAGDDVGGLRPIEDAGLASRNSTAADRDALRSIFLRPVFPMAHTFPNPTVPRQGTYPVDVSRNGGGRGLNLPFR